MQTLIQEVILDLTAKWIEDDLITKPRDVGDGQCEEFAQAVISALPRDRDITLAYTEDWWSRVILPDGTPSPDEAVTFHADIPRLRAEGAPLPVDIPDDALANLIGGATHVWICWNGQHFDASAPEGRPHFLDMPFFADQISGLRDELLHGVNAL